MTIHTNIIYAREIRVGDKIIVAGHTQTVIKVDGLSLVRLVFHFKTGWKKEYLTVSRVPLVMKED